ncbi:MAG: hypothetical protein EXQ49_11940 [Acidobacteria bacterium]|nr:hypothetical protein [Acidobacteriota bacterium]
MRAIAVLLLFGGLVAAGAPLRADDPVQSRWRADDVRIDGVMTDWTDLTFVSKEVALGVANDREHLYFVVVTSNAAVTTQIIRAGLSVYVDPKGKRGQAFGVRIPPVGSRLAPGTLPPRPDEPPLLSYFDILGPGRDDLRRVMVEEASGVALRIGSHDGAFFMEVQVPFESGEGRPYAPGIEFAKGFVALGIVTPEPPRTPSRGGGRGGGMAGGMGGGLPTGGMSGGKPEPAKGKSIGIWTTVRLATTR